MESGCSGSYETVGDERTGTDRGVHERELCESLVGAAPGLEPAWREHLADNFAEPLPHVFMGDVARYFDQWAEAASLTQINAFLDALERVADSGGYGENLVTVSFVEYFVWGNERQNGLMDLCWDRMGPATQRAVVGMRGYPGSLKWDAAETERRTELERLARKGHS